MKLTIGYYTMRNGQLAYLAGNRPLDDVCLAEYSYIGWCELDPNSDKQWEECSWNREGHYWSGHEHEYDLIKQKE